MAMPRYKFIPSFITIDHVADCVGVSLFFAVRGIATDLRRVRDLTEIKHVEKEDKMISEGTEDGSQTFDCNKEETFKLIPLFPALKLDTLLKLSQSTSYDLRAAYETTVLSTYKNQADFLPGRALRIISERSTKGSTRDLLLQDLASKHQGRRSKALSAMHFLVSNRACMGLPQILIQEEFLPFDTVMQYRERPFVPV